MGWNRIVTQSDAESLMEAFDGFHDGCLHELHLWTGYSVNPQFSMTCGIPDGLGVRILVQRQSDGLSAIELLFSGVRRINVVDRENRDSIIYGATLLVRDKLIYWATDDRWTPDSPSTDETFVVARGLSWRDASEWMGESLRLGVGLPAQS